MLPSSRCDDAPRRRSSPCISIDKALSSGWYRCATSAFSIEWPSTVWSPANLHSMPAGHLREHASTPARQHVSVPDTLTKLRGAYLPRTR